MKALCRCALLSAVLYLPLSVGAAADAPVSVDKPQVIVAPIYAIENPSSNAYFFIRLLQLILDKTRESHGDYVLKEPAYYMVDNRLRAALEERYVDVIWFTTFPEAEQRFLPIKQPLLGEITDYRLLLIRAGEQARFDDIDNLGDLRQLIGGIGAQWVDADVMAFNQLPFMTAPNYQALFRMLAAGRFDYFSRGLYQIWGEVERYPGVSLEIESSLMLHYPNAIYYFVHRDNHALAERLQVGLDVAIEDGSYRALFNQFEAYLWAEEQLRKNDRKILRLKTINSEDD